MTPATDPLKRASGPAVIAPGRPSDRPRRGAQEKKAIRGQIRQLKDSIAGGLVAELADTTARKRPRSAGPLCVRPGVARL